MSFEKLNGDKKVSIMDDVYFNSRSFVPAYGKTTCYPDGRYVVVLAPTAASYRKSNRYE